MIDTVKYPKKMPNLYFYEYFKLFKLSRYMFSSMDTA